MLRRSRNPESKAIREPNDCTTILGPDGGIPAKAGQGPTRRTLFIVLDFIPPGWWNGRHAGLKILWPLRLCGFKSRSGYPEAQEVNFDLLFLVRPAWVMTIG